MKTSRTLVLFFLIILICPLFSTEQIRDKLIGANGKIYDIYGGYPLESFYSEHPDRRPDYEVISTALWRGYIGYYKLGKKALYHVTSHTPDSSSYIDQFPSKDQLYSRVLHKAFWYSGYIAFPTAEKDDEGYRILIEYTIEKGDVTETKRVSHAHDLYIDTFNPINPRFY